MQKIPRRRGQAKPLRPAAEGPWSTVDDLLLPGARPDVDQLVCEVRGYLEAERRVDLTALPRDRERRRTEAARVDRAVTSLLTALRILRTSHRVALADLEPETARAFRSDVARFQLQWMGYLGRLQGRARGQAQHREHPGPRRNYVLEVVADRLTRIVTTYRRNKKGPLLARWTTDEPHGVLFDVAAALREDLPCLPRSDAALYQALTRARTRLRRRRQVSSTPQE